MHMPRIYYWCYALHIAVFSITTWTLIFFKSAIFNNSRSNERLKAVLEVAWLKTIKTLSPELAKVRKRGLLMKVNMAEEHQHSAAKRLTLRRSNRMLEQALRVQLQQEQHTWKRFNVVGKYRRLRICRFVRYSIGIMNAMHDIMKAVQQFRRCCWADWRCVSRDGNWYCRRVPAVWPIIFFSVAWKCNAAAWKFCREFLIIA